MARREHTDDSRSGTAHSAYPDGRPQKLVSDGNKEIYVDPANGDDANSGDSQAEAYATLHRAAAEVPEAVYHDFDIYLAYGTYGDGAHPHPHFENIYQTARSHHADADYNGSGVRLLGHHSDNPYYDSANTAADVTLGYVGFAGIRGSEDFLVSGVEFHDARPQAYDARITFDNCNFVGGDGASDETHSFGGHCCLAKMLECDFTAAGSNTTAYDVFNFLDQSHVVVDNCTATGYTRTARMRGGSILAFRGSSQEPYTQPADKPTTDGSCLVLGPEFSVNGAGAIRTNRAATFSGSPAVLAENDISMQFDGDKEVAFRDAAGNNQGFLRWLAGGSKLGLLDATAARGVTLNPEEGGFGVEAGKHGNLSGATGDWVGEVRVDDGTNTTHGNPDLCMWIDTTSDGSGDTWQQVGTANTFA